jgi:hypothetical protein
MKGEEWMTNIRVDTSYVVVDGSEVVFTAPCDCTEVRGLKVYYPDGSKVFTFKDAHGKSLTGLSNLFSKGALVKTVLDVTRGYAYIQNANTNSYLEGRFRELEKLVSENITVTATSKTLDEQLEEIFKSMSNGTNRYVYVVCDGANAAQFSLKSGGNRWMLLLTKITSNYARAFAWCTGTEWVRSRRDGAWGEWKQEAPSLAYGVEYLTTELYNGYPVYTKLINCGAAPVDTKFVSHGLPSNFKPIRSFGTLGSCVLPAGYDIPKGYGNYHVVLSQSIGINNMSAYKGQPVSVQVWYIKE